MNDIDALRERIEALEVHVAHQERTIEELNEAVSGQWKQMESLTRQVRDLADRLQEAEHRATAGQPPEPPPPHY